MIENNEIDRGQILAWGIVYFVLGLLAAGCMGICLFAFWLAERLAL